MKCCDYCNQNIDPNKQEAVLCFLENEDDKSNPNYDKLMKAELGLGRLKDDGQLVLDSDCYDTNKFYVKVSDRYYCDWSCIQLAKLD